MKVLMFQERFVPRVESGDKRHTIRRAPVNPVKPGDELSLRCWSGKAYRSKQRTLRQEVCSKVETIQITETGAFLDEWELNPDQCEGLAVADGFASFNEMQDWHRTAHGLPFAGVLISWVPTPNGART
ncbi:ASCH domain-containing protein [Schlesneria sp. T3-172]|uniref:ASCH domain-containing protein n=1 Tax=Schlesneria sphaerica TaxID=3373610 RepID=UPI0037C6113B